MSEIKHTTRLCLEECKYRNKVVPFCGYCLYKIVKEREEEKDADRKAKAEHTE